MDIITAMKDFEFSLGRVFEQAALKWNRSPVVAFFLAGSLLLATACSATITPKEPTATTTAAASTIPVPIVTPTETSKFKASTSDPFSKLDFYLNMDILGGSLSVTICPKVEILVVGRENTPHPRYLMNQLLKADSCQELYPIINVVENEIDEVFIGVKKSDLPNNIYNGKGFSITRLGGSQDITVSDPYEITLNRDFIQLGKP